MFKYNSGGIMKNILLAVSGSIACYKAFDLMRSLKKQSSDIKIKVILTQGAEKFLKPDLFRYLGAEECYKSVDDFDTSFINSEKPVLHINLARWCDAFVLYPASANTLAKLSQGKADDLLSSIFLSLKAEDKKIIFPAMNTQMYSNPITQENLERLQKLDNLKIYPPDSGELLCGENGSGKLPLPDEVSEYLLSLPKKIIKKKIMISTGATESPLDTVRYLTNPSSGKTGYLLTREALSQGYEVITVATRSSKEQFKNLKQNPNFKLLIVKTTEEMLSAVLALFPEVDLYVSAAAPCDINFKSLTLDSKLKKSEIANSLEITKTPDILAEVLKQKTSHQKIIGFAAESDNSEEVIQEKLKRKKVDLLIANEVHSGFSGELKGFRVEEGWYRFCRLNSPLSSPQVLSKHELAHKILEWFQKEIKTYDHLQKSH